MYSTNGGVTGIHPIASEVGIYILKEGGNAIDAAIAMQLALAVVYPEAGNIGGGGFLMMRLSDGTVKSLDFRETAPAAASRNMYIDSSGVLQKKKSLSGHLACGIPGTIAGIFQSLKYGKLPISKLIQPAIDLAEKGYILEGSVMNLSGNKQNTAPNVFNGEVYAGKLFKQTDLANTLKRIRDNGAKEFYEGKTAQMIVEEMKRGGGLITLADLKSYRAKWRDPISFDYRGYKIYSMGLPSSGGIILNQMLKMIEPYPIAEYGYGSTSALNLMIEVARRAYHDRAAYLGDPDFINVPVNTILSADHIKNLMSDFEPGKAGKSFLFENEQVSKESKETTHFSIVDKDGNAVSVTTTLNGSYGSRIVVGGAGFILNNQMNDFCIMPGVKSASGGIGGSNNIIEPGKRMLSSMTPTIVCKNDKLFLVLGTPGGTTIPTSVFQAIVNVIDFKMNGADAVSKPKFHHEWLPDTVYIGPFPSDTIVKLQSMGYKTNSGGFSALELIKVSLSGPSLYKYEIVSQHGSAEGY